MNSLDDFARFRPDAGAATADELDDIWNELVGEPSVERSSETDVSPRSRRRFAFVGAAAVLALGVVAIASFADRAEAPPAVSETSVAVTSTPAPTVSVAPDSENADASIDAGEPPVWGITEDGWTLAEFDDRTEGPLDMVRLFAGPEGLNTSWVAIVSGMSEPLLPIPGASGDDANAASPISTQRVATEDGSMAVVAGGVSGEQAMAVFRAVQDGGSPPDDFVETDSADAAVRTIRYRFVNEEGESIIIGVTSGGIPNYDGQIDKFGTDPDTERLGVDESAVLRLGEDRAVIVRTGFWVSTIAAPPSLEGLVQLADSLSIPAPPAFDRLAIGDSVMLGAAASLIELGFVVDAVESRVFNGGVDTVRALEETARLPDTMVVHLGSNGSIGEANMAELVDLVVDVDTVLLLTSAIDSDDSEANNVLIFATAAANPNIHVLDWDGLADQCSGGCFESDGVHLKPVGRGFYATLIAESIGD